MTRKVKKKDYTTNRSNVQEAYVKQIYAKLKLANYSQLIPISKTFFPSKSQKLGNKPDIVFYNPMWDRWIIIECKSGKDVLPRDLRQILRFREELPKNLYRYLRQLPTDITPRTDTVRTNCILACSEISWNFRKEIESKGIDVWIIPGEEWIPSKV